MRSEERPRILVFAYACEPLRGSEPGAGWGLVRALSEFADCTVLVGPEHMPSIRRWERRESERRIEFVEVAEPSWAPAEPRHRFTRFLVYLAWLQSARAVGLSLHRQRPFSAVHHATYSVYWLPTPASGFDVPCIWGPVGGAVSTPGRLWRLLGWRGLLTEIVDLAAVRALATLPAVRRASRCALVFVQNDETRLRLPADAQGRAIVLNHALFTELPIVEVQAPTPTCLFVGALEPRKGARLALMGLAAAAPDVRLVIAGDGPDRGALEAYASELGVSSRVRFVGAIPRTEVMRLVTTAAAVVFTGLREEGGIALAEAMLAGTPVIVLAHGGARTIAEATRDPDRVALIEPADLSTMARRIGAAMSQFSARVRQRRDPMLDPEQAKTLFRKEIEQVCFATLSITTTASRS